MELGGQKGVQYHSNINYRKNDKLQIPMEVSVTDPNRRSINWKESSLTGPSRERRVSCISYKKLTATATQPIRNCHHTELLLLFNGLLFKTTHPHFLLLLQKITFLFFVGLCLQFCHNLPVPNCSCYQNKPIFAGKAGLDSQPWKVNNRK